MMKRIALALAFLLAPTVALAQSSCPYIVAGAKLTVAQWQSCFMAKQDVGTGGGSSTTITAAQVITALGFTPVNRGGDTMTGRLGVPPAATKGSINLTPGAAPSAPDNGDIWTTSAGMFARINGTTVGPFTAAAGGTVTSVALSLPASLFTVTGSPITGAGTLNGAFANQSQNTFLGGPCSGSATAPTVRAFCTNDFPSFIPQKTTANIYTATQSTTVTALTSAATVNWTWGAGNGNIFNLVLSGNVTTLANPGGQVAGTCALLRVQQPAVGGPFTISGYGTFFKFSGGTHPTYSTAANAIDVLNMCGTGTGEIDVTFAPAFS